METNTQAKIQNQLQVNKPHFIMGFFIGWHEAFIDGRWFLKSKKSNGIKLLQDRFYCHNYEILIALKYRYDIISISK